MNNNILLLLGLNIALLTPLAVAMEGQSDEKVKAEKLSTDEPKQNASPLPSLPLVQAQPVAQPSVIEIEEIDLPDSIQQVSVAEYVSSFFIYTPTTPYAGSQINTFLKNMKANQRIKGSLSNQSKVLHHIEALIHEGNKEKIAEFISLAADPISGVPRIKLDETPREELSKHLEKDIQVQYKSLQKDLSNKLSSFLALYNSKHLELSKLIALKNKLNGAKDNPQRITLPSPDTLAQSLKELQDIILKKQSK